MDGVQVREIRDSLKLSREKFAHLLGVSFFTVYRWERGERRPSAMAETLLKQVAKGRVKMNRIVLNPITKRFTEEVTHEPNSSRNQG